MWKRLGTAVPGFGEFSEELKIKKFVFLKRFVCLFEYQIENKSINFFDTPSLEMWRLCHFYLNPDRLETVSNNSVYQSDTMSDSRSHGTQLTNNAAHIAFAF